MVGNSVFSYRLPRRQAVSGRSCQIDGDFCFSWFFPLLEPFVKTPVQQRLPDIKSYW